MMFLQRFVGTEHSVELRSPTAMLWPCTEACLAIPMEAM